MSETHVEEPERLRLELSQARAALEQEQAEIKELRGFLETEKRMTGGLLEERKNLQIQVSRLLEVRRETLKVIDLLRQVGKKTQWRDRKQTDRVFAWYEFDDLRAALGEGEGWGDT